MTQSPSEPSSPSPDAQLAARHAVTDADRMDAFRLRYAVYIAEQGKPYSEADHDKQILTDDLDQHGHIVVVCSPTGVIGTVRANWFDTPATHARYADTFELPRFAAFPASQISACSRLAASMEHRHVRARELLFESIYQRGLDRDTRLCFATCATPLLRMFRKYGFREFTQPLSDSTVGMLHRTLLVLDDLEHLARVRSPFYAIAQQRALNPQHRPWISKIFDDYSHAEQ